MTSILDQEYIEPQRPYSQRELQFNRNRLFRSLRIGGTRANHQRCRHIYFVKRYGRKEKEIKESKSDDIGNCSVCWKFNKTPRLLKTKALGLIYRYTELFETEPEILTYSDCDVENVFYNWLYEELDGTGDNRRRHRDRLPPQEGDVQ